MAFWGRTSGERPQDASEDEHALQRKESAARRPGKFTQVSKFMRIEENDDVFSLEYTNIMNVTPGPGSVVHVRDEGSRLDQRVMLVLRRTEMGFVCLTFCLHPHSPSTEQHWRVCEEGKAKMPMPGVDLNMKALEVILQPYGELRPRVSPQHGVFINIEEIWNVEYSVPVIILGKVVPLVLKELASEIKDHFCKNLDKAIPPVDQSPEQPSEQPEGRRKSSSASPRPKYAIVAYQKEGKRKVPG